MTIKAKLIKVIKDKWDFEDGVGGICFPDDGEIFVEYFNGEIILHELIHILYNDPLTRESIVNLFNTCFKTPVDELIKDEEFVKSCGELLHSYDEEDYADEIYAYWLSSTLLESTGDDSKKAIYFLINYTEDFCNVYIFLDFITSSLEDIIIE